MSTTETARRRYPLHVTISVAFAVLLAVFGFTLIVFNYTESRKAALVAADDLLDRIDAHMQLSVEGLYGPVENVVDVASQTLPENSAAPEHGVQSLGFLSEVLRLKPDIATLFVGYEDGDFYSLRQADSWPGIRERIQLPDDAAFVLESIEREGQVVVSHEVLLYDDSLELLRRIDAPWEPLDPRLRPWYASAIGTTEQIATEFYRFFTTGQIGATVARRLAAGGGVFGADMTLAELSSGLEQQQVTPSTRLIMLDPGGQVIALPNLDEELASIDPGAEAFRMPQITELKDPVYHRLAEHLPEGTEKRRLEFESGGRTWLVSLAALPTRWGDSIVLATLVPRDELLTHVVRARDRSLLISAGLLLVALLFVIRLSRYISGSLHRLAREAEQIRELRLDTPLTADSNIREVDDLASTMAVMKDSLQQFLAISRALSAEKKFDRLLEMILDETRRVSGAAGGAVLLRSEDDTRLEVAILQRPGGTRGSENETLDLPRVSLKTNGSGGAAAVECHVATSGRAVKIDDASSETGYEMSGIRQRFGGDGTVIRSVLCVPLRNPQGDVIGVLELVNAGSTSEGSAPFRDETLPYIEALSSNAAIALDNRRLLKAQRELMESFIRLVAGAIDAKSPYTHGHCQRVPVVARLLAEAAQQSTDGPFADFELSDDEWYALHLASWLHDCGKVTTPEYVVDKATKLETLYDRIHEVRMRFEVLWRDAEIEYLAALVDEACDAAKVQTLRHRRDQRRAQIRDDFDFIAACNGGDRPMTDESIERVKRIGSQTWLRNLDDRLGLSHGEQRRRGAAAETALPVTEPILVDRPEHVIPRDAGSHPFGDNQHGFRMDVPDDLYNLGEIYNLCIRRGTLNDEERFKINEHVVQTIRMLGRLPFPRELRDVPRWAGNHHEKLDGTGYPRRLMADELSIAERIMAMADIFEALTASDRPYTPPKPLSRVIGIMRSMCDQGHLCPELFELLLRSGIHLRYAEEHLQPEQIDGVDLDAVLSSAAGPGSA